MARPLNRAQEVARAQREVDQHRRWIENHGRTRSGYRRRYDGYGDGGDAIYEADMAALRAAQERLWALLP